MSFFEESGKSRFERDDLLVGPEILRDSITELFPKFVFFRLNEPFDVFPAFLSFDVVLKFDGFGLRFKRLVEFQIPWNTRFRRRVIALIVPTDSYFQGSSGVAGVVAVS